MNPKTKSLLVFIACLSSFSSAAQITEISDKPLDVAVYLVNLNNPKYEEVEGSPYLQDDFLPAKINEGTKMHFVRLNIVDHIIEVKQEDGKILILDLNRGYQIAYLDRSSRHFNMHTYLDDDGASVRSFFQLLKKEMTYSLYMKERKKLIPKKKAATYQDKMPAKFIEICTAFYCTDFKSNSSHLIRVPSKKKKFMGFFGTKAKQVEKYIKQKNLDYKNPADLVAIFDFYSTADQ